MNEPERLQQMLEHGNLIVTARDNGKLAGVSRSLTDFMFCTYLSDLAVDTTYQQTPKAKLILLAALAAIDYYPKIGMAKFDYCYYNDDVNAIK